MTDYRERLLANYSATHIDYLDLDPNLKLVWFSKYCERNYLPLLRDFKTNAIEILEVGCNQGYLLRALRGLGFTRLYGVDASPVDVERARQMLPEVSVTCADAVAYLQERATTFDVIITKATLEHIPKAEVIPFLQAIRDALKPGGLAIIDVPNMDWLFGLHERYMDFTHEVGFTRESIAQVMRNIFADVRVIKASPIVGDGIKTRIGAALRTPTVRLTNIFFRIMGEGAANVWWDNRGIIATGRKN